ncbi:hypothetical protein Angca_008755, partial [Angiostrongylus cantonensis]
GAVTAEYAHYFDPNATNRQSQLGLITIDEILSKSPDTSAQPRYTPFNELSWVPIISSSHPLGVIFGGTENGTVVFIDAHKFVNDGALSVISSRRDHHGHVLSVDYSVDNRWAISAGGAAQLLLWDLTNLTTPFTPGNPNFADQVKRVRWNRSVDNIVVSLSSHRGSLWDMRRPGGPILEFAEFGSGCDWADICWKPGDSSTLIVGSQLALTPGIQKWDLRYPTAPVNEFHLHDRGVTAMDWHRNDPRMVVSAGNDGFVRVFNPDTGEVHGCLQLQRNDKVRALTWSEVRPDLFAIQYFQHPTEFRSIEAGCESSILGRLNVSIVPAWVSAAPVGASFALGGKMATHYRQWDEAGQMWHYGVQIAMLPVDQQLHDSAMELQNACDSKSLGAYCEDRAHCTEDRNLQILWTFLAAMNTKQSRREFIQILGFGNDELKSKQSRISRTSTASNEVTQLTNILSVNHSSPRQNGHDVRSVLDDDVFGNDKEFFRQSDLDYSQLDENAWLLFDTLISEGDEAVIDQLLAQKDYATAFMLARSQRDLLDRVTERYIAEQLSAPQRLFSLVTTGNFDQLIETFPREQWSRLFGLILSRTDRNLMVLYMRKIASEWSADKGSSMLHAALAAILAQDVELLLHANHSYSSEERVRQAIVLRAATGGAMNEEYETLLCDYCEKLIAGGVSDVAWRLLSGINTNNERLLTLRHSLYFICGGEERTMSKEPENPLSAHIQAISSAISFSFPQHRSAVFHPPTTSRSGSLTSAVCNQPLPHSQPPAIPPMSAVVSNFSGSVHGDMVASYPINSVLSSPGPAMHGYLPAPNSSLLSHPPVVPGFNPVPASIPPPLMEGAPSFMPSNSCSPSHPPYCTALPSSGPVQDYSISSQNHPVSTLSSNGGDSTNIQAPTSGWNDPPSLPGRKASKPTGQVLEVAWKPLEQTPVSAHSGLPSIASGIPQRSSSSSSQYNRMHQEMREANLSFEDRSIVERLYQLIENIITVNQTPATLRKAEETKMRLRRLQRSNSNV